MSTIFSIGEIAKIFNISTQTLRLYDRIDLLKPSYINKETGYRYYSIGQFVSLECIKRCKAMGFSLDEIKELIGNDSSIEATLELTKKQKSSIRKKIEELKLMENQLDILERKINDSIKVPFNKIFFSQNEERSFIKYKDNLVTQEEVEVASREVILDLEEKYEVMEHDITFLISYDEVLNHNKVLFKSLMVETDNSDENKIKIPAGTYLTMYYDDSTLDNRKYYNKMINFIHKNNLQIEGDFLETAIVLRVNKDGMENTLAKLEILCK